MTVQNVWKVAVVAMVLFLIPETNAANQQTPVAEQVAKQKLITAYNHAFAGERVNQQLLRECVHYTYKYSVMLCIGSQLDTELAMWHVESRFHPSEDDGTSFGISQINPHREKEWRRFWARRHVYLPKITDPETQIAFGVAEFQEKLRFTKGNVWTAVRRYNGGGPMARKYARTVFAARKKLFNKPYTKKEVVPISDCRK